MAYNVLTGSYFRDVLPALAVTGTFHGNYAGDASALDSLPIQTVSNAVDNYIPTFAGSDSLYGESNLRFTGTQLTVAASVSASYAISASHFFGIAYYGDGSNLTGISGGGTGIFTVSDVSVPGKAYYTGSVKVGGHAGSPTGSVLHVSGTTNLSGSLTFKRVKVAVASYTASADTYFIGVDTTSNVVKIELNAARFNTGSCLVIKDEGGNAATNNIILSGGLPFSPTSNHRSSIDGNAEVFLQTNYGAVNVYTNGTHWFIY